MPLIGRDRHVVAAWQ